MMDLKNILSELRRLESLVEEWRTREQISVIERDLALDKLKALYEAVRFADVDAGEPGEPEPSAAPIAVASISPIPLVEEALPVEEEPAVIDFEELMSVEEPVVALSEPEVESAQPNEEPMETNESTQREQPTDQPEVQQPADEVVEAVKEHSEERPAVLQNSLFDLEEIPVHRRGSRRVMLSLYGEAPVRTSKRKNKEEHKAYGIEEVQPPKEVESTDQPDQPEMQCDESAPSLLAEAMREEISARSDVEELSETQEQPQVSHSIVSTDEETDELTDDELLFREEAVVTEPLSRQQSDSVSVLGEVIHADQQTLADTFASGTTLASQLAQGGESLRKMIALNDRFLLRAELFDDNQDLYEQAIEVLDNLPSLDDCMIYIAENYSWNANSEAAKLLFELLERRYGE